MPDEPADDAAQSGTRWAIAFVAVVAALLPSLLVYTLWPDPEPAPSVSPEGIDVDRLRQVHEQTDGLDPIRIQMIRDIYLRSQLDYDECKADFTSTVGEPSSERLPFYFC
ncbi:MAG: hypothetical protein HKN44_06680 [Ilumatobacter sp.]|nr:hypothetical protein [Ilumatobacter sp.]